MVLKDSINSRFPCKKLKFLVPLSIFNISVKVYLYFVLPKCDKNIFGFNWLWKTDLLMFCRLTTNLQTLLFVMSKF